MRRVARNSKSPYREGFDARYEGKNPSDCPYRLVTDDPSFEQQWKAGWNAADEQLAREGKKDA